MKQNCHLPVTRGGGAASWALHSGVGLHPLATRRVGGVRAVHERRAAVGQRGHLVVAVRAPVGPEHRDVRVGAGPQL